MKKNTIIILVITIALGAGIIFLVKGCLSAYDERSAQTPTLYFEKNGRQVLFAVVKNEEATSYKSNGSSTSKTVYVTYYVQTNDANTGAKIAAKKVKDQDDMKNRSVTVLGNGNGNAWVFMDEPMAFDPFTLEKIVDKTIIENKNPTLKGKMPQDDQYYQFNTATNELIITATDGTKYALSTSTLLAKAIDGDGMTVTPLQAKIAELEKQDKFYTDQETHYYDMFRNYNDLYSSKKISEATYLDSTKYFNRKSDSANKMHKAIKDQISDLKDQNSDADDKTRDIKELHSGSKYITSICIDADTLNGTWYGLKNSKTIEEVEHRFYPTGPGEETGRNNLYSATLTNKQPDGPTPKYEVGDPAKLSAPVFLQGGFLLNRETATPIHLADGFIVCYKETVGSDGKIMLARIDTKGNIVWSFNTNANQLEDWIYTGTKLIVLSNDNKELSSDEANVLTIIDMQNGKTVAYDYFKDKLR